MNSWQITIATVLSIKKEINRYDKSIYGKITKPSKGISEVKINNIEENLDMKLHIKYREFFKTMNGWKGFYKDVDILRIEEIEERSVQEYGNKILDSISDEAFDNIGIDRKDLFIIAYGVESKNIFFMTKITSKKPGIVIWYKGSIKDIYRDFKEFFLEITKMNLQWLNEMKEAEKRRVLI